MATIMKIEACFDEGREWIQPPIASVLHIGSFINILLQRGNTYFRIDGGEKQKVELQPHPLMILMPGICERCGNISMVAKKEEKKTCVYCAYYATETSEELHRTSISEARDSSEADEVDEGFGEGHLRTYS